jgi:hypothetical protein
MTESGLSQTDTIGLEASLILTTLLTIFTLKLFSNKTSQLTELCQRFSELNDVLKIDAGKLENISSGVKKNVSFQFTLGYSSHFFVTNYLNK